MCVSLMERGASGNGSCRSWGPQPAISPLAISPQPTMVHGGNLCPPVCVCTSCQSIYRQSFAQRRCEVCGTDYRGEFTVPPPPPPSAAAPQMLAPMFILNAESAARIAAARHHIQVLEAEQVGEGGDTQVGEGGRREPGRASWITPH